MAVTPDKLELPIFVADTARELGLKYGVTLSTVHGQISQEKRGIRKNVGIKRGARFVRVEVDGEGIEELYDESDN